MKMIRANELGNDAKIKISEIFVDGFYKWLKYFSKNKKKLAEAFRHMFHLDVFYVAVIDGEIAGIAACTDGKNPPIHLDRKELQKHLGVIRGIITHFVLKRELEERSYPFEITEGMGMIEFVATATNHRGKGVATAIIQEIIRSTPCTEYALEVADTNTVAIQLLRCPNRNG